MSNNIEATSAHIAYVTGCCTIEGWLRATIIIIIIKDTYTAQVRN